MSTRGGRIWLLGAAAMSVLALVQRASGFAVMFVLSRVLDARGLGAYAFTQSTSQAAYGLARLGLDAGMHVGLAGADPGKDGERMERLLGEGFTVFVAIAAGGAAVLSIFAGPLAARLFDAPQLEPFVHAAAAVFACQAMAQYAYIAFAGLNRFGVHSRVMMVSAALMVAAVSLAAWLGGPLAAAWALAAAQLGSLGLSAAALARVLRECGLAFRPLWPRGAAASMLRVGLPFYAGGLFLVPVDFANLGYLTRTGGVETLADLRVAQALSAVAAALPTAMAGPTITFLTERSAQGEWSSGLRLQLKAIAMLAVATAIVLATIWPGAIGLAFGWSFEAGRTVGVLALAAFIPIALLGVLQGGLLAQGASQALFWTGVLHAGCLAALGWLWVGPLGLAGFLAAQAAAAVIALLATVAVLLHRDRSVLDAPTAWALATAIAAVVLIAVTAATAAGLDWRVRAFAGVAAAGCFAFVAARRVLTARERPLVRKAVQTLAGRLQAAWPGARG
ncbi:lipopolysaccharide biosynthesis protein [Ramlibacter sp. PS4R-6]|uniref:lipopolysaccharide biosynthesis protein n=1 Tax=Ramlibacter sp. PS4R-6 TaxID=3133438 RepID=UPI0030B62187